MGSCHGKSSSLRRVVVAMYMTPNTASCARTHRLWRLRQELAGYDLVVNCTGLGAKLLFGDERMYPVRWAAPSFHLRHSLAPAAVPR